MYKLLQYNVVVFIFSYGLFYSFYGGSSVLTMSSASYFYREELAVKMYRFINIGLILSIFVTEAIQKIMTIKGVNFSFMVLIILLLIDLVIIKGWLKR